MNNYTLVIKTEQASVSPDQVKAAVEDLLLRALPPVTLRFGSAAQPDPRTILFAVASDGRRDFIASTLHGLENRLPARVERIDWGNQVAGSETAGAEEASNLALKWLRTDPYAKAEPQSQPTTIYQPGLWSNLRGTLATIFLLSWIIFLGIYAFTSPANRPPLLESRFAPWVMQAWLLLSLLAGPPYAPWRMIKRLTCDPEGIQVQYLFSRSSKRLAWSEIHTMTDNTLDLTLYSGKKPVRFSAKQRAGFQQEPMLIKTIITRAQLHYVGVAFPGYVYKRADAPD